MNDKNTKYLFETYNKLFIGRYEPLIKNLMGFGFDCLDGWTDLLDDLCNKIYIHCEENNLQIPKVVQVKEKFGSLRFYMNSYVDDYIDDLIQEYETKSESICEVCGKPGKIKSETGWLMCRCDDCLK